MSTLGKDDRARRPPGAAGGAARGGADRGPARGGPAGPAGRRPGPERPPSRRDGEADRLRRLATGFTQAFLEVESGRRTRAQLGPLLGPHLAARLAPVWVRGGPPGKVVRTYGVRVAPDRYEAVAVVRRGGRVGAVVIAFTRARGAWRVVDVARPEDGVPADRVVGGEPASR